MSKSVSAYHLCESSFEFLLPSFYSRLKSHGHTSLTDYLHNKSLVNLDGYNAAIHPLYGPLLDDVGYFFQICLLIESNLVYMEWIFSLVQPLIYTFILLFLLPLTIVIILFGCSFFCFYKKHWLNLKASISENNLWEATLKSICVFWEWHGALFHGHELVGAENFPKDGPALLIYYHGAMPTDFFYVHSKMVLYHNRRMRIVADNFLFKVPGLRTLLEVMEVTPGTVESCVSLLRQGNILAISPGGVREAFFSDHNYDIVWGNRLGFAKTACEAKVPIIPMFTKNYREALRTVQLFRRFFQYIYEKTRLPLVPIYGMFPVKLVTYIGEPIEYDPNRTPEQLRDLTKQRLEELIQKHQKRPGSIFRALLERFVKLKQE